MRCWICDREMGVSSVIYGTRDHRHWWYCAACNYRRPEQITEEEFECSMTSSGAKSLREIAFGVGGAGSTESVSVSTSTTSATEGGPQTTNQGT